MLLLQRSLRALKLILVFTVFALSIFSFQNCGRFSTNSASQDFNNSSSIDSANNSGSAISSNPYPQGLDNSIKSPFNSKSELMAAVNLRSVIDWSQKSPDPEPWRFQPLDSSRSACAANEGILFEVGPGKLLSSLADIPWIKLLPCDYIKVYYRSEPYREIVFFSTRGAKNKFITIEGVAGPNGERPIIDGENAVSINGTGGDYLNGAGLLVFARPVNPTAAYGYKPGFVHVSGFKFQHAVPPYKYTSNTGAQQTWNGFTAGIVGNPVEFLVVTNCEFNNNGLGIFVKSDYNFSADLSLGSARQSYGLYIKNNYFHENGLPSDASKHHSYTEAIGTIYEANFFGPLVKNSEGDLIKDRSGGIIIRNNYFDGGTHSIALRDPESNGTYEAAQLDFLSEPLMNYSFIVHNFFHKPEFGIVVGFGDGDYGALMQYRTGKIFFLRNIVVFEYTRTSGDAALASIFSIINYKRPVVAVTTNNLFYTYNSVPGAPQYPYALFFWGGTADFKNNWSNTFVSRQPNLGNYSSSPNSPSLYAGTVFDGTGLGGLSVMNDNPGFTDLAKKDFSLLKSSPFFALPSLVVPNELQIRGIPIDGSTTMTPFK